MLGRGCTADSTVSKAILLTFKTEEFAPEKEARLDMDNYIWKVGFQPYPKHQSPILFYSNRFLIGL